MFDIGCLQYGEYIAMEQVCDWCSFFINNMFVWLMSLNSTFLYQPPDHRDEVKVNSDFSSIDLFSNLLSKHFIVKIRILENLER